MSECYGCGNPETEVLITKSQMVQLKCAACGFISDVDMRDKLTSFILKNPPEPKKSSKDKKLRRAEKERLKEGAAADKKESKKKEPKPNSKKKPSVSDEEEEDDGDDDVTWQTDTSLEAAQKRIQEQLNTVTADMVMLSTTDTEKSKKDKKGPPSHDRLVEELKGNLNKGITRTQIIPVLESLSGTPQEVMSALYEALLGDVVKGYAEVIVKKKNHLAAAISQTEGSQVLLLKAIEEFCGKSNSAAVKEVALVLKALYDADILEEESVVEWYNGGLKDDKESLIWKNAKPFVEWLQSAESESEEE